MVCSLCLVELLCYFPILGKKKVASKSSAYFTMTPDWRNQSDQAELLQSSRTLQQSVIADFVGSKGREWKRQIIFNLKTWRNAPECVKLHLCLSKCWPPKPPTVMERSQTSLQWKWEVRVKRTDFVIVSRASAKIRSRMIAFFTFMKTKEDCRWHRQVSRPHNIILAVKASRLLRYLKQSHGPVRPNIFLLVQIYFQVIHAHPITGRVHVKLRVRPSRWPWQKPNLIGYLQITVVRLLSARRSPQRWFWKPEADFTEPGNPN